MSIPNPPLRGDGLGVYRIHIVGNSGMFILHEFSIFQLSRRTLRNGKGKISKTLESEFSWIIFFQSTLGAYLSGKLNVLHIPLDEVAWKPGWERTPDDEFKEVVRTFMAQNTRGWVIDGNYRALGTLIPDEATDVVCTSTRGSVLFPLTFGMHRVRSTIVLLPSSSALTHT